MHNTIKDSFAGHIDFLGIDCCFAFSDGYSLKILPYGKDFELFDEKCEEKKYDFNSLGWILATDDFGYDYAFLLSEKQLLMCYSKHTITLITDMIVKTHNRKSDDGQYAYDLNDLKGFTVIEFTGNAVNAVFSPKVAINKETVKKNSIEWLPVDKYAKSFSTEISGKKCELIFTVIVERHDVYLDNTDLGELHSVIRLEFEESQELSMIEKCWNSVCIFLAFCVGQYNVNDIDIGLWNKNCKIGIIGIEASIYCKINNDKVEGIKYRHPAYYRFQIDYFGEKLGSVFTLLNKEETKPILSFLPRTNIDFDLDRSKIRDLCTSLEVEFDYRKKEIGDTNVAELVKRLKEVAKKFKEENPKALDENTYNYICGSLGLISSPAKNKLERIYSKYASIINEKIKVIVNVDCTEKQTKDDIGWLVKLRNNITHSAQFTGSEIPNAIYFRLKIAIYCSILERAGYSLDEISEIVKKYFG